MTVSAFLKLIRYKNLLVYALCLILVRTNIIDIFYAANGRETPVSMGHYMIFVLTFILALAAFYIINDYNDQAIDDLNRLDKNIIVGNDIKPKTAKNLFVICICLSFFTMVAFLFLNHFNQILHSLSFLFIFVVGTTYNKTKKVFLGKNIFMALIPVVLVFFSAITEYSIGYHKEQFLSLIPLIAWLTIVLALVQFIREIVKDMQDREGDAKYGVKTLIIKYGEQKTKRTIYILTAVLMIFILAFQIIYFQISPMAMLIGVSILVHIPLIYFLIEFRKAEKVQDYGFLADLLSMIFISILFITFLTHSVVVWLITVG